jgi:hypothetical protein
MGAARSGLRVFGRRALPRHRKLLQGHVRELPREVFRSLDAALANIPVRAIARPCGRI